MRYNQYMFNKAKIFIFKVSNYKLFLIKQLILVFMLQLIFISKNCYANDLLCKYFDIKCEIIKHNEVIEREGLFYKKHEIDPYTGFIKLDETKNIDRDKYLNLEEKLITGKIVEGKKTGKWLEYALFYKKDEIYLRKKLEYKNGELISASIWRANGNLLEKYSLKNGLLHGIYEEWDETEYVNSRDKWNNPKTKGTYKNGKKIGCWRYAYGQSKQFGFSFNPDFKYYAEWVREECYNQKNDITDVKILNSWNTKYMDGQYDQKNRCYIGEWKLYDRKTRLVIDKQNVGKCNRHIYQEFEFHIFFNYFEKTLKTDKSLVKYY